VAYFGVSTQKATDGSLPDKALSPRKKGRTTQLPCEQSFFLHPSSRALGLPAPTDADRHIADYGDECDLNCNGCLHEESPRFLEGEWSIGLLHYSQKAVIPVTVEWDKKEEGLAGRSSPSWVLGTCKTSCARTYHKPDRRGRLYGFRNKNAKNRFRIANTITICRWATDAA